MPLLKIYQQKFQIKFRSWVKLIIYGVIEGRNPKTIAACSIYIALKILNKNAITIKEISRVSEIAENTIKNAYRDIQAYLHKIIPQEYMIQAK